MVGVQRVSPQRHIGLLAIPTPRLAGASTSHSDIEITRERLAFWVRHAYVGLTVTVVTVALVLVYAQGLTPAANRRWLSLVALAAGCTSVAVCAVIPSLVRRNRHLPLFYAWSFATVTLVLLACQIGGGLGSPLTYLLFLPLLFGSLAYAWPAVLGLGLVEIVGIVALWVLDSSPDTAGPVLLVGSTALATLMSTMAAHNRGLHLLAMDVLAKRLEQEAIHDGLSQCLNRRGFDAALTAELARAERYQHPVTLLMLDVDHLKRINDTGGHLAGDAAIRQVTAAMQAVARQSDILGRLGGDEFGMVLPETSLGEGMTLATRLQFVLRTAADPGHVSVSIGIAQGHPSERATTPYELLCSADAALYVAKSNGRDRTEVART